MIDEMASDNGFAVKFLFDSIRIEIIYNFYTDENSNIQRNNLKVERRKKAKEFGELVKRTVGIVVEEGFRKKNRQQRR